MTTLIASTSWAPFFQTAIGALIGAGGAIGGGAFASWFTWQKERQSVAAAFAAEVQGVVGLQNWNQLCEGLSRGAKFRLGNPHFPVFEANVGKIGLLPGDLAAKVVRFYSYAEGIFGDFGTIETPMESEARFTEQLVKKIETMLTKGNALVPELQKEAARSWKDYLQPT